MFKSENIGNMRRMSSVGVSVTTIFGCSQPWSALTSKAWPYAAQPLGSRSTVFTVATNVSSSTDEFTFTFLIVVVFYLYVP